MTPNEVGGYDVRIPDFGIVTQGDDLGDAAFAAQDALTLRISGMLESGEAVEAVGRMDNECPDGSMSMGIVAVAEPGTVLDDTMTVQEAADTLDVTRARIYAMIEDGSIRSRKEGNMRLVDASDVMERFNNPRGAGRPSKNAAMA